MVNIYLFIELIGAASAPDVAERIKGLSLANCKFANVVVLSNNKLVAQLDCSTPRMAPRLFSKKSDIYRRNTTVLWLS